MVTLFFILFLLITLLMIAWVVRTLLHGRIDRRTVATLDLARYMGLWYEIARLENRFELGMVAVTARYTLRDDGSIEVVNSGVSPRNHERHTAVGRAKTKGPGRLWVSFAGPFGSDYNILELSPEYEWALVGGRSASYLWILARHPELDAATFELLKTKAQQRGYDIEQLLTVDQSLHRAPDAPEEPQAPNEPAHA